MSVPTQFPANGKKPLITFVGEAPSTEEVQEGRPFVGPDGRVFNAMMRAAGLDRKDYMVTNVYDVKAPDNDVGPWMADAEFSRPHLKRLQRELKQAGPTVIVPLGNTALWALTGFKRIMSYRGNVMKATELVPGVKMVPALHPGAVRKAWKFFSITAQDFKKAEREAQRGPEVFYPKRKLYLQPMLKDIEWFADKCHKSDLLSVDIETGWGQITCIGFAPSAEEAMCIPFVDTRKPSRSYWGSEAAEIKAWGFVRDILGNDVPKLGQNFTYDAFWLLDRYGIPVRNYRHDTRLLHHAINAELPKDLAFLAAAYSEQSVWKTWAGHYSKEKRDA